MRVLCILTVLICAVRADDDDYENYEVDADTDACEFGYAGRAAVLARGDGDGDVCTARREVPQWVHAGQEWSWNGGWNSARDAVRRSIAFARQRAIAFEAREALCYDIRICRGRLARARHPIHRAAVRDFGRHLRFRHGMRRAGGLAAQYGLEGGDFESFENFLWTILDPDDYIVARPSVRCGGLRPSDPVPHEAELSDEAEFSETLQGNGFAVDDAELAAAAADLVAEEAAMSATISAWASSLTDDERGGFLEMMRAGGDDYVVDYRYVMGIFDVLLLDTCTLSSVSPTEGMAVNTLSLDAATLEDAVPSVPQVGERDDQEDVDHSSPGRGHHRRRGQRRRRR